MKIPFHTEHCREGWGCMSACPVYVLTQQFQELEAKLKLALQKEPDNERP
jgi:Fe-S-cluster-containing hydrogenase component 2